MNTNLRDFLLHQFKIHLNRCLIVYVNDIQTYLEYIQTIRNHSKLAIGQVIKQLWLDNLIGDYKRVSDDVYIIYE